MNNSIQAIIARNCNSARNVGFTSEFFQSPITDDLWMRENCEIHVQDNEVIELSGELADVVLRNIVAGMWEDKDFQNLSMNVSEMIEEARSSAWLDQWL